MAREIKQSSEFSECGKYRYVLRRDWSDKPIAMVIGLNPSKAGQKKADGSEKDDPTIRTLIAALDTLGFGGLRMCNLYALVSSKPAGLWAVADPLANNDAWLETTAYGAQKIIFAWGNFKGIEHRTRKVREMFPDAMCFGRNSNGSPWHPLALMYGGVKKEDLRLTSYNQFYGREQ